MPRGPRLDAPGALQHFIARGIERRPLFNSDRDRSDFLDRLASLSACTGTRLYAWALIPNHFHLLLRTGSAPLSSLLRRLLTGYAVSFNGRHRRSGHLFQNRFKSILVEDDPSAVVACVAALSGAACAPWRVAASAGALMSGCWAAAS